MKIKILLLLTATLILCSCVPVDQTKPETSTDAKEESTVQAPDEADTRIAYYEELVKTLQAELLELRTDMYVSRIEYEARIEALEKTTESTTKPAEPSETSERDFTYSVENGKATIVSYTGTQKNVQIPHTIAGYPVYAIGESAFASNTSITSVTIPDGVETLAWFAFSGCIQLETVAIPSSVQSIGYGALENCHATLTVKCADGSYAQLYARSYGLRTAA